MAVPLKYYRQARKQRNRVWEVFDIVQKQEWLKP